MASQHLNSKAVQETCDAINEACRAKGGAYANYSCQSVSWDDASRGTVSGGLSCWGGNITDTRLWSKSGVSLYTCRSDNWNEKLGQVDADSIAVVVGNHEPPEWPGDQVELKAITLREFLKNAGAYANYAGVDSRTKLFDEELDKQISIQFQTTFLPVADDEELSSIEFCTEAYNYNTRQDDDPRNAIVLCTTQGFAFQQDGAGAKNLFHHVLDTDGTVRRYWLEAERSQHKVGGAQTETKEEAMSTAARGKATASVIGIEAMGTRFNALMTIQIPVEQKPPPAPPVGTKGTARFGKSGSQQWYPCTIVKDNRDGTMKVKWEDGTFTSRLSTRVFLEEEVDCGGGMVEECCEYDGFDPFNGGMIFGGDDCRYDDGFRCSSAPAKKVGQSNAARVSRGSYEDTWDGVARKEFLRDAHQHITVTIVLYNTVAGGVPSAADVEAAVDDMERLYEACSWNGRLAEHGADFMKSELTVATALDIGKKIATQPYTAPKCGLVKNGDVFPH